MKTSILLLALGTLAICAGSTLAQPANRDPAPRSAPLKWRADPNCANHPSDSKPEKTRSEWAAKCPQTDQDFIALALSGGGTKAAVFAGEAMFYLEAVGLLQHVDMISSVSGGSFAAAYYALSCDKGDNACVASSGRKKPQWDYETGMGVLQSGFRKMLRDAAINFFIPRQTTPVKATHFADFIDSRYLGDKDANTGKPFKFGDLTPYRPALVLNSTLGSDFRNTIERDKFPDRLGYLRRRTADEFFHFAFTDYYFNTIGQDLSQTNLGFGVASSAAFPALIGYATITNERCPFADKKQDACKLALLDGGANDNQGLVELFDTVAELADCQARSDVSSGPCDHLKPPPTDGNLQRMHDNDRALALVINSSLTEATGVSSGSSTDYLLGTINRAFAAVDTYSAVSYNLRKRLYEADMDALNDRLKSQGVKNILLSDKEIGLVTLDRYNDGGAEASLATSANLPETDWIANEFQKNVPEQQSVFARLTGANARAALSLGNLHPQCLFEQSKLVEAGLTSLASISRNNAACLRRAARWSTALRMEELCKEQTEAAAAKKPLHDPAALLCDGNKLRDLDRSWHTTFDAAFDGHDRHHLDCDLSVGTDRNSKEQNLTILRSLRNNDTFSRRTEISENPDPNLLPRVCTLGTPQVARAVSSAAH